MNKIQIFISLGLICLLNLSGCSGDQQAQQQASGAPGLVLVSPHNEFIREEFADGFNAWRQAHGKTPVTLEWQDRGGSVEIVQYVSSTFEALGEQKEEGIGIDLLFGGGAPAFEQLKKAGCTAQANLTSDTLSGIPATLGGVPLRDPEGHWFGAALSSFGIVYNKPALAAKNIPAPQTWADLANPAYAGQLSLADPSKSGSARLCYEVILQKHGWGEGWGLLMQIAANTREFTAQASGVPRDVAQGNALAGMCIDFYAYNEIAERGGDTVGYVNPANATATSADPIGLLRGAAHRAVAEEFITFVLAKEGQGLWGLKPGAPGGPAKRGLWRMPILPAIYAANQGQMLMDGNPFSAADAFNINEKLSSQRSPLLGPLFVAAFLSNSDLLKQAWQKVSALPAEAEERRIFVQPPFSEQDALKLAADYAADPRRAVELDNEWHELFRERYQRVGG